MSADLVATNFVLLDEGLDVSPEGDGVGLVDEVLLDGVPESVVGEVGDVLGDLLPEDAPVEVEDLVADGLGHVVASFVLA